MGTDRTSSTPFLQGLLLQGSRYIAANIDLSLTAGGATPATQAGPKPGQPVAQQDSDMVLDTTGSQSADKAMRVQVQRSGHPGTDDGSIVWRYQGEDLWTGWDAPLSISDFEYVDVSNTNDAWEFPDAVVTTTGKIVAVVQKANRYVTCWWRDPDAATWNEKEIYDSNGTFSGGAQARPCVLLLPSGRLLCFFWITESGTSLATIRMHYSDDDGATWTVGQFDCLDAPVSTMVYNLGRLRACYLNGQVMLVCSVERTSPVHQIFQYASDDLGCNFALIDTLSSGNSRVAPVLLVNRTQDRIIFAYVSYGSSGQVSPYVRVLGSASEPISGASFSNVVVGNAEWGLHSAGSFSAFELAGYCDEDGNLYLFGNDHDAAGGAKREITVLRSADDGETWVAPGDSSAVNHDSASVWYGNDAAYYLRDYCTVGWRGMGVLIHMAAVNSEEATNPFADSLMATFLGGHTRVCQPQYGDISDDRIGGRASWERTWLPFTKPEDLPFWGITTAGSPVEGHGVKGRNVTHTTTSDQVYWSGTPTTAIDEGVIFLSEFETDTNDSLEVVIDMQVSNGTTKHNNIQVIVDGTGLEVFDVGTGSTSKGTAAAGAADGIQIIAALAEDVCSVWYRLKGTDTAWQQWVNVVDGAALSSGVATTNHITIGTLTGQASGTASFKLMCHSEGTYTGAQLAGGQTNPRRLLGRTIVPTPIYLNDGLSIFASDGPGVRPDRWHIDTAYTYAATNTDPRQVATPAYGHRTLSDSADADINWVVGESTSDEHGLMNPVLSLYIGNANWRTAELYGRSGGTWSKIADIDMASGATSLKYTRSGDKILCDTSGGLFVDRYILEHILAGSTWDYGTGTPRKIRSNSGGAWTPASVGTVRTPVIELETYATGDSASGSSGAIWSKDAVVLVPLTATDDYDAFRLRILTQTTADGYFETGVLMLGYLLPFGTITSMGRAQEVESNNAITTSRNGVRTVRSLGDGRRSVDFDWTEGVFMEDLASSIADTSYIRHTASTGAVIATPEAVPFDMHGAYLRASGAAEPVVYLARAAIGAGPGSVVQVITNRALFLYGRLVSESFRLDTAEGNEWSTDRPEYIRVNTTRIEEER